MQERRRHQLKVKCELFLVAWLFAGFSIVIIELVIS